MKAHGFNYGKTYEKPKNDLRKRENIPDEVWQERQRKMEEAKKITYERLKRDYSTLTKDDVDVSKIREVKKWNAAHPDDKLVYDDGKPKKAHVVKDASTGKRKLVLNKPNPHKGMKRADYTSYNPETKRYASGKKSGRLTKAELAAAKLGLREGIEEYYSNHWLNKRKQFREELYGKKKD